MTRRISLALAPVLLLTLGACSGGTSAAEDEACWAIHDWWAGGGQGDLFDGAISEAQDHLDGSEQEALVAAADRLAAGAETDRPVAAEAFVEQCEELGWEPREG